MKILRKIKNTFKTINKVTEGKSSYTSPKLFYTADLINEDGYILEKDAYKVNHTNNSMVAVVQTLVFSEDCVVPLITTDEVFETFSEDAKIFTIFHELGHFAYHRDRLLSNDGDMILNRNENLEIEADGFTVRALGKERSIKAMENIIETLGYASKSSKELKVRLKAIKKL